MKLNDIGVNLKKTQIDFSRINFKTHTASQNMVLHVLQNYLWNEKKNLVRTIQKKKI
jgi:hypothetical protein